MDSKYAKHIFTYVHVFIVASSAKKNEKHEIEKTHNLYAKDSTFSIVKSYVKLNGKQTAIYRLAGGETRIKNGTQEKKHSIKCWLIEWARRKSGTR